MNYQPAAHMNCFPSENIAIQEKMLYNRIAVTVTGFIMAAMTSALPHPACGEQDSSASLIDFFEGRIS